MRVRSRDLDIAASLRRRCAQKTPVRWLQRSPREPTHTRAQNPRSNPHTTASFGVRGAARNGMRLARRRAQPSARAGIKPRVHVRDDMHQCVSVVHDCRLLPEPMLTKQRVGETVAVRWVQRSPRGPTHTQTGLHDVSDRLTDTMKPRKHMCRTCRVILAPRRPSPLGERRGRACASPEGAHSRLPPAPQRHQTVSPTQRSVV